MRQSPREKHSRTRTKHTEKRKSISFTPKTEKQREYLEALRSHNQLIVFGPAGTGKTYCVASHAANEYHMNKINKIVITRPHVPVGRDIGYLPGTLEEKCAPWALPITDVLTKHLGQGVIDTGFRNKNIEVAPLATMRGRSFENSFVICDEAQNISLPELKMLLTRVGEGSSLVLNGDTQQSDLKGDLGLSLLVDLAKKYSLPIPIIEFSVEDIVRSDICKQWIKIFMEEGV